MFRYLLYTTSLIFLYKEASIQTNRVSIVIAISSWHKRKQFRQSEWFRFLFCRISYHWCVTVCSIIILTNHYVVIANAVLSNRIVIYWQLMIVSRNYRHITHASVGVDTSVTYVVSSLLTAVAFLCFPTYYFRCQQCVTAHMYETSQIQLLSVVFQAHPFITVANIKWVYFLDTMAALEAYFNSGSEVSHAL